MNKDTVFKNKILKQFEFDNDIVSVFDDMLSRSVPFYDEVLKLTTSFAIKYCNNNSIIYDLGCSTASTLVNIANNITDINNIKLIGIDNSTAMLQKAKEKSKAYALDIRFINDDIFNIKLEKSDVIISNYTLQFIRPPQREQLIKKIYDSLNDGQIFIFSEKIVSEDSLFNKQFIDEYLKFKQIQGYSKFEISQKREALENVLIPYTYEENKKMCIDIGFSSFECLFRWINFATFIVKK